MVFKGKNLLVGEAKIVIIELLPLKMYPFTLWGKGEYCQCHIKIKHCYSRMNICQVPKEMLKTMPKAFPDPRKY